MVIVVVANCCGAGLGLTEASGDVAFGDVELGIGENLIGRTFCDDGAKVHKYGAVADAVCLLHVVSDDDDRVPASKKFAVRYTGR